MEVGAAPCCLRNVEEGEVKSPEGRRDFKYLEGKRETSLSRKRLDRRMEAYERKEVEGVAQDAQEIIEGVGKWNERGMEQESNGPGGMRQENIDRGEVSRYDEIGEELDKDLLEELANSGVKYNPDEIVTIGKTTDGKLVWLEDGNNNAGLTHILERHEKEFEAKGIPADQIPDFIIYAIQYGKIVDTQRTRTVYEVRFEGKLQRVAISISSNGFIVGANPKSVN